MLFVFWAPNDQHHVTWTGLSDGPFRLERAEALAGPWTLLYAGTATQHISAPPEPPSVYQRWYYRLTDALDVRYGPASVQVDPDRVSRYVIWHANRQVRRSGIESCLFTERQSGAYCPECWDALLERRVGGSCLVCDGSGRVSGWPDPVPFWVSYGIEEPAPVPTDGSKAVELLQVEAWTSAYPLVKIGDYVVRPLDRRVFDVVRWQPTRKGPFLLRQQLVLRLVERAALQQELASLARYDLVLAQGLPGSGRPPNFLEDAVRDIVEDELSQQPVVGLPTTGVIDGGTID